MCLITGTWSRTIDIRPIGKLPRAVRPAGGEGRQQRCRRALRRRHERILRRASPGDEPQRGVVRGGSPQIRKGPHRVV